MSVRSTYLVGSARAVRLSPVELLGCWRALGLGETPGTLWIRPPGETVADAERLLATAVAGLAARGLSDGARPHPTLAGMLRILADAPVLTDLRFADGAGATLLGIGATAGAYGVTVVTRDGTEGLTAPLELTAVDATRVTGTLLGLAGPIRAGIGAPVNVPADALDTALRAVSAAASGTARPRDGRTAGDRAGDGRDHVRGSNVRGSNVRGSNRPGGGTRSGDGRPGAGAAGRAGAGAAGRAGAGAAGRTGIDGVDLWAVADRLVELGIPGRDAASLARMCGGIEAAGQLGATGRSGPWRGERRGGWVVGFHRTARGWFVQLRRGATVSVYPADGARLLRSWHELIESVRAAP